IPSVSTVPGKMATTSPITGILRATILKEAPWLSPKTKKKSYTLNWITNNWSNSEKPSLPGRTPTSLELSAKLEALQFLSATLLAFLAFCATSHQFFVQHIQIVASEPHHNEQLRQEIGTHFQDFGIC